MAKLEVIYTETFRTPLWVWQKLLKAYPYLAKGNILDPSAGHGELILFILKLGNDNNHTICDIRKDELSYWKKYDIISKLSLENCIIGNFLNIKLLRKYQNTITNPPFSLAKQFVDKCLKYTKSGGYVVILQRLDFLASQKRAIWFRHKPLRRIVVLTKRPRWTKVDDSQFAFSDSRDYCFFFFQKDYIGKPEIEWMIVDKELEQDDILSKVTRQKKRFYLKLRNRKN